MCSQFKRPLQGMGKTPTQSFQSTGQRAAQQSALAPQNMDQRPTHAFQERGQQSANPVQGMGQANAWHGFGQPPSPILQAMSQRPANSASNLEIQRGNTARGVVSQRDQAAPEQRATVTQRQAKTKQGRKHRRIRTLACAVLCALLLLGCGGYWYMHANAAPSLTNHANSSPTSAAPGQRHGSDANAQVASLPTATPTATATATTPPWHPYTGPSVPLMSISAQDGLIVISISKQNLTVYNKGQVVFVSLVTTGMPQAYTPTGTFQVIGKTTNRYFGPPAGSNLHYAPEHINYALQLTEGGIFIHDSAWRSVYGPGTNLPHHDPEFGDESGSHGCINSPLNIAYWLYKSIAMGTTVQIVS